ncbi:hypothetical protein T01_12446 [Trichinella spiralis]|uniref:Uncharacterized protein n=1 Tax=Trichinella spiralis TaxID=6334 RepID=A0A0V1B4X7_TRISP|nr:hypothetical protein T01_12446 [Trichinella spiralis]
MEKTRTNIPSRRSEVEVCLAEICDFCLPFPIVANYNKESIFFQDLLRQRRNGCVQAFQTQRCSWRRIRRRARVQEARLIDDVDNEKTPFQNFKHQPICLQSNCKSILHFPAKLSLFTVVVRLCMVDDEFCARYCSALYYLRFMLIIVIKQNRPFRHTLTWWKNSPNS